MEQEWQIKRFKESAMQGQIETRSCTACSSTHECINCAFETTALPIHLIVKSGPNLTKVVDISGVSH